MLSTRTATCRAPSCPVQDAVRVLLEAHADVNVQAENGDSPLHDAAENGHEDVVKLLLDYGANPKLRNRDGKTPMDVADDSVLRTRACGSQW